MIEERGVVVEREAGFAWVETQRHTTCESCAVNKGCGTGTIAKVVGRRSARVKVANDLDAEVGDEVLLGLAEDALLRGSLAIYSVPLLLMLAFAMLGNHLSETMMMPGEAATAILGVFGLIAGFGWVAWFGRSIRRDGRYQPVILRRLS